MHVQEEIIMDSGGIELSQGEYSAVSNEEARLLDLSAIKLPPKIRKHGRPKELDKTIVCLPKKKMTGPFAFKNLIPDAKEKIMLSWFIGETEILDVLRGKKITEDMVEVIPENVNNACICECVYLLASKDTLLMMPGRL